MSNRWKYSSLNDLFWPILARSDSTAFPYYNKLLLTAIFFRIGTRLERVVEEAQEAREAPKASEVKPAPDSSVIPLEKMKGDAARGSLDATPPCRLVECRKHTVTGSQGLNRIAIHIYVAILRNWDCKIGISKYHYFFKLGIWYLGIKNNLVIILGISQWRKFTNKFFYNHCSFYGIPCS